MKWMLIVLFISSSGLALEIPLGIEETQFFKAQPNQKIRIRGRKYISITETENGVHLTGKAQGTARISIGGGEAITLRVLRKTDLQFHNDLKAATEKMMGLKLELLRNESVITGQLLRLDDWISLSEVSKKHSHYFKMQAVVDADVRTKAQNYWNKQLLGMGLSTAQYIWQDQTIALVPKVNAVPLDRWQNYFRSYDVSARLDQSQVHLLPLVRVKILVAEVSRNFSHSIGIDWPTQIQASLSPKFNASNSLQATLNLAESQGEAQILASPNLIARSGGTAEFLAGGEFPIRVSSKKSHEVVWKKHGILLKIQPQADHRGHLNLEITSEVSMLDGDKHVEDLPQMKTNRITSQFNMLSGKTIILSGLIQNTMAKGAGGIAGVRRLPIIGGLFESQKFQQNKSELIIFVTPNIVQAETDEEIVLPGNHVTN